MIAFIPAGGDLSDFRAWCGERRGAIAVDTETSGLDLAAPGFSLHQVAVCGADGTGFVLDGRDRGLVRAALPLLAGKSPWAHNASYDWRVLLHTCGADLSSLRDTRLLALVSDPELLGRCDLKTLRLGTQDAKDRLAGHWGGSTRRKDWLAQAVAELPPDDPALLAYVATDAIETARLATELHRSLASVGLWDIAMREQEIDALWRQRTGNGIRTDSATVEQELAVLDQARARLAESAGVDLARNSHATRAWVLDRGITIVDQAGKPTLSHRSFAEAKVPPGAEADWALFLRAREISRTENKVRELSQSVISGRVWPEIHTIGAVTGRMSISDPALQNLPADVRRVLMADEGDVLVGCDLDRVEPRTLAALSGDGALVEAVKGDVYMVLAREIWGAAAGPGHRAVAKTALLAIIYGQGTASLARRLKVEPREAANIRAGMRRAWPTAMRWLDGRQAAAERGERQYSWAGRPLPISHEAPYRAANHAIQSSAADLFKLLTLQVAANLPTGATVFLPIHDELIVECPKGLADEVVVVLGEQMRAEINGVEIAGAPVVLGGRLQHA